MHTREWVYPRGDGRERIRGGREESSRETRRKGGRLAAVISENVS